jgi:hypothetical protein
VPAPELIERQFLAIHRQLTIDLAVSIGPIDALVLARVVGHCTDLKYPTFLVCCSDSLLVGDEFLSSLPCSGINTACRNATRRGELRKTTLA